MSGTGRRQIEQFISLTPGTGASDPDNLWGKRFNGAPSMMNEVLIEAFQQKDWAMKVLIAACEDCSVEEWERSSRSFGLSGDVQSCGNEKGLHRIRWEHA